MEMSPNLDTNPEAMNLDTLVGKISSSYMEMCPSVLCQDPMASVMILNISIYDDRHNTAENGAL